MALIYNTTMDPTKMQLLAGWLPQQEWFTGDVAQLTSVGAYRFDDPDGEVGMEGHLLTAGDDVVYHVPVTYRGADLPDVSDSDRLGTSAHGVLGTRWIFNAEADPVYRAVLADTIMQGGSEAQEFTPNEQGELEERERYTFVSGSGIGGSMGADAELTIVRRLGSGAGAHGGGASAIATDDIALELTATWPGQTEPLVVARLCA